MKRIRESRAAKGLALLSITELILQSLNPLPLLALTSGPSQPEVESFQPVGLSEMVDPFSGDFSYSIPLLDIGGYPLNLAYQSGISMDQEASWVGLGWNLHTGAITRDLRGLPDDFKGESVVERVNLKPNKTVGVNIAMDMELFGFEANDPALPDGEEVPNGQLSVGLGIEYNNYTGVSVTTSAGLNLSNGADYPMTGSLNLTSGKDGLQISPNVSFSSRLFGSKEKTLGKGNIGFGANINSRKGLTDIGLNGGVTVKPAHKTSAKATARNLDYKVSATGISNSSSIDIGPYTFTPSIEHAMETYSFSGRFKIGGATVHQDFGGSIDGYGSVQKLTSNTFSAPAYGYMYAEKANNNDNALLDYNREKDGNFSKHHKHLPLTAYTYDMFSIAAQGLGGTFRAFRNDVGYVYNNKQVSPSNSGSLGVEVGIGQVVDVGIDLGMNMVQSTSGAWRDDNYAIAPLPFRGSAKNDIKESYFLRMTGEKIPEQDPAFLSNTVKGTQALRYNMNHTAGLPKVKAVNSFTNDAGNTVSGISSNQRDKRQNRNTAVYFFTMAELKDAYPHKVKDISPHAKKHHIAQIVVVTPEGMRYVFGLAAYNTRKVERSFAVGGTRKNPNGGFASGSSENDQGIVNYSSTAASTNNDKGIDNFFQETETPAYVHSWMLTEILSPDYSDLKGDGPTQDDLGSYVKFSYGSRDANGYLIPDVKDYGWRTPTTGTPFQAGYMEGLRTNPTDDKANVVFGTKDVWYCHSIESKTHKALFELEDRQDACGVDEHGNIQTSQRLKLIKSISHVSIEGDINTPPVKKINFRYNYNLCPGTPNSTDPGQGKLTLERVFFTYENSNAGEFSPYVFTYNQNDENGYPFSYIHGNTDRWGVWKDPADNPSGMSNGDFPYALQDAAKQAKNVAAWSMKQIELPSGGKVNITYESDDYAYVQDRHACNMYTLKGFAQEPNAAVSNQVFGAAGVVVNQYLVLNVPDAGATLSSADFMKKYLKEEKSPGNTYGPLKYLYFRFLMNVNKPNDPRYEYVSGYAEIDYSSPGNYGMTDATTAYIKIKNIMPTPTSPWSSPFAFAGWSFSRMHTPEYAYNLPQFDDSGAEQIIKTIASASVAKNMFEMLTGVNRRMMLEGYASTVQTDASWVRLFDPDGRKYGGGYRVKKLEINDGWTQMVPSETSRTYGQEYSYTLPDGRSSGVAQYEPAMGADENPFKIPVYNDDPKLKLVMEERYYVEEPFGESFYPSPSVGYSRVEVKDIVYDQGVTSKSTGKMRYEFYTAKDFPTIVRYTKLDPIPKKSNPIVSLLSFNSWNYMNVSQGYSIEINDMHGKARRESQYAEGASEPFSYTEHYYKTDANGRLANSFPVIASNSEQTTEEVGVEYDMVVDVREQNTTGMSGSLAFNIGYSQLGALPTFSFSLFPGFKRNHTRFRSIVTTKVIQRYGLEEKTISYDKGALLETRTLALDKQTGNVILQEMTNEYKDKYYKTDLPAHWVYSGMAQAGKNIGFTFGTSGMSDNTIFDRVTSELKSPVMAYLLPGDEVVLNRNGSYIPTSNTVNSNAWHYWVAYDQSDNKYYLIDYSGAKAVFGNPYPAALEFKVIRSGHRNQQQAPAGSYTSMLNPLKNVGGTWKLTSDNTLNVLNTSATEFKQQWQTDYAVPGIKSETVVTVYQNQQADDFIGLLNSLYANNFLGTAPNPPLGHAGWSNTINVNYSTYGVYTEPLFGCNNDISAGLVIFDNYAPDYPPIYFPLQAFGYPYNTTNSLLSFDFTGTGCMNCLKLQMFCVDDYTIFDNNDWWQIDHFNSIISTQYISIPGAPLYTGPVACHLVSALMSDNSTRHFIILDHCFGIDSETVIDYITTYSCVHTSDMVNPYIANILGNWRPSRNWVFQGSRNNSDVDAAENLRRDGYLPNYKSFWVNSGASWTKNSLVNNTQYENWNWTAEATIFSPYGFELESMDPLGNYSAAINGFKNMLVMAVGANTRNKEFGFDGFEDYYSNTFQNDCVPPGFRIADALNKVSAAQSHTGKYSMLISADYTKTFPLSAVPGAQQSIEVPYVLDLNDMISGFSPNSGAPAKKFILSFWAMGAYTNSTYDYTNISADVRIGASSLLVAGSLKKTDLVENWQKFEYEFIIPASASGNLSLILKPGGQQAYFDDIRIHPFDANMKSFVYDRTNFRFTSELDENNFASFYDYDLEGKPVRVRKESERGVLTVKETRGTIYKR
ncbi:MAG: hypothetical protein IBJ09_00995 [Bacteroidia bacterium]|nr:hypothetical protein [Bacteroidia bacterium]